MKTLVIILAMLFIVSCSYNKNATFTSTKFYHLGDLSLEEVTCKNLLQAFQDDEVLAKQTYDQKEYYVSGVVLNKGKGYLLSDRTLYLAISDKNMADDNFIICLFSDDQSEKLENLKKGEEVLIRGKIDASGTRIVLENSQLFEY